MPKLTVQKKTDLKPLDAFNRVKAVLNDDKDLRKLDPSYKCAFDEAKMSGSANGKMFKAEMKVSNQSAGSNAQTNVEIVVDLPLALMLVKGVVEKTLQRKLDESLA